MSRVALLPLLLLACSMPTTKPASKAPLTAPEATDHRRTSTHAEVLDFLRAVRAAGDPRIVVSELGRSGEGRELPLVVVADPTVRAPEQARASGKPVVLVTANIHAGEVEGKEALLALLREVAWGPDGAGDGAPWPVPGVVTLFVPIYNADGNERFSPKNRPLQQGPDNSGQRPNAAGLDLNRDALKLEAPESRALAAAFAAWDPHVYVDLHTTNGSAHGYELTYASSLSPSVHPLVRETMERDWLPSLRSRVRDRHGFELYDYGNFMQGEEFKDEVDTVSGWRTYDHRPRFVTNAYGLRNRLSILSEAYSYADFRTRIAVTRAFVVEILGLAAERGAALPALCRRADEETVAQGREGTLRQATAARLVSRGTEPLLLRGFSDTPNPVTGELERVAQGPRRSVDVPAFVRFEGEGWVEAPRAYLLPPASPSFDPAPVVSVLRAHGLRVQEAGVREAEVDVPVVRETSTAGTEFQFHHQRRAACDLVRARRALPAGTLRVPLDQPLGRLAFQLLDPRADDGLLVWNAFDAALARGAGAELPVWLER